MFAITADQRGSRVRADLVPDTINTIIRDHRADLLLPPDQNAGDEIQLVTESARAALQISLDLTRTNDWSVGVGVGDIETPLPAATRMVRGDALIAARSAVDNAKRHPTRFWLTGTRDDPRIGDTAVLINLLIALRDKRSEQGWQLFDLLESGLNQKQAAAKLGVTPQAIGNRMTAASIRVEQESRDALVRTLERADAEATTGR